MKVITLSSIIGDPVRTLKFPALTNVFVIAKTRQDEFNISAYLLIERQSMTLVLGSPSLTDLIYRASALLSDFTQTEFNEYLRTLQE
jgi:hypothetical protein